MTSIDPTTLTPDELAPMLRAWASGMFASEAAVELLIAHDVWPRRRDFLFTLVDAIDDGWGPRGSVVPMAAIDWDRVEAFLVSAPASRSEISVLRCAASLAGAAVNVSVRDATAALDEINAALVLNAVAHRCGWHERGTSRRINGTLGESNPRLPGYGGSWTMTRAKLATTDTARQIMGTAHDLLESISKSADIEDRRGQR